MRRCCWLLLLAACHRSPVAVVECGDPPSCREACGQKIASGCYRLGVALAAGNGVARDLSAATEQLIAACTIGDGRGCARVALDPARPDAARRARALELLPAQCAAGSAEACDLGGQLDDGELGRHALSLYRTGCDGSKAADCLRLAELTEQGRFGAADAAASLALFQRACDLGLAGACARLGLKYMRGEGVEADGDKARPLLQRAGSLSRDGG